MFDEQGRVWITSAVRPPDNPTSARRGRAIRRRSSSRSNDAGRHLAVYDPKTKKMTHIGTCFGTHHLMFAEDANHTLWTSGGGQVVGWLNTKMFDETGDEEKSQGWTALVLDTNGNGRRDEYVEPNEPVDPAKDKRITARRSTRVAPAPDGSVWGSVARLPRRGRPADPGREPAGDRAHRGLRAAVGQSRRPPIAGLLPARHGRRPQRRGLGRAGERAHGQLRPAQVQGPAQRPDRHRPALPGGVDALRRAAAAAARA